MTSPPVSLLGAERPRVELKPASAYTFGPECCELAALAGLEPEPWQADALDILLSVRDAESQRWACREYAEIVGRQEGKSIGIGLPRAFFGLLGLRERLIIWSAHQYKTSLETFLQARDAMYRLGEEAGDNLLVMDFGDDLVFIKVNNTNGEEGFELWDVPGGRLLGRWRFVARSVASGRGFSGDCNLVDEAFAYTLMQRRALAPTLLARPNPQTIYLSSPPLDGNSGDVLFALKARAAKAARNLGFRDWGPALLLDEFERMKAAERAAWLDDPKNLVASLPALGRGRVTEQSIRELRDEFEGDDLGYASEVFCLWPRQATAGNGWRVIAQDVWRSRGGADERPDSGLAFALDASWPDARMGAIGLAGGLDRELLVQVVDHRPGTSWMVERATELRKRWPHAAWVLDPRGPAGHLRRDLVDAGFTLVTPGPTDVAHSFGRFREAVLDDPATLRHYDYQSGEFRSDDPDAAARDAEKRERAEALSNAVRDAATRPLGDGKTWGRPQSEPGADLSPLTAVTLALGEAVRLARKSPPEPQAVPSDAPGSARPETADLALIGF